MKKKKNLIEKMEDLTTEEEATHDKKKIPKSKPKPMVVSISAPKRLRFVISLWICCLILLFFGFVLFGVSGGVSLVCSLRCLMVFFFFFLSSRFVSSLWVLESLRLEFFGVILKGKKICLWLVAKVFVVDVFLLF